MLSIINQYLFEKVKINLKTNEIIGKDITIDFVDKFFENEDNDPILKGRSTMRNLLKFKVFLVLVI